MPDYFTKPKATSREEATEQIALHEALKRTRLEEAAKNPKVTLGRWALWIVAFGIVLFLHDTLAENLWMIIILLLVQIEAGCRSVHKRIDAILSLDSMNHTTRLNLTNKTTEKDADGNPH